jgi:hypothetical protein
MSRRRDDRLEVGVQLDAGPDADDQEIEELTAGLRRELLELDVNSVVRVREGEVPPGARGLDIMALGSLLFRSPELLKTVAVVAQSWASSRAGRSIELHSGGDALKLTGVSSDQQRQLIAMFVERHSVACE